MKRQAIAVKLSATEHADYYDLIVVHEGVEIGKVFIAPVDFPFDRLGLTFVKPGSPDDQVTVFYATRFVEGEGLTGLPSLRRFEKGAYIPDEHIDKIYELMVEDFVYLGLTAVTDNADPLTSGYPDNDDADPASWLKPDIFSIVLNEGVRTISEIYPIYNPDLNADKFVDADLLPPVDMENNGVRFQTSALKAGQVVDLIGVSCGEAYPEMNRLSELDPCVKANAIIVKFGDDIIEVDIHDLYGATFTVSDPGNYTNLTTDFRSAYEVLDKHHPTNLKKPFTTLKAIVDNNLAVRLSLNFSAFINTATGVGCLYPDKVSISAVTTAETGDWVPPTPELMELVKVVEAGEIIGWRPGISLVSYNSPFDLFPQLRDIAFAIARGPKMAYEIALIHYTAVAED